jgi:hypothetical protein
MLTDDLPSFVVVIQLIGITSRLNQGNHLSITFSIFPNIHLSTEVPILYKLSANINTSILFKGNPLSKFVTKKRRYHLVGHSIIRK